MPDRTDASVMGGPIRPHARVLALRVLAAALALLGIGAALLYLTWGATGAYAPMRLPWYVLLALFAAVEASVLHVQVRREAQTVSMSEIPLVLGLFLADPAVVVIARVAGSLLVYAAYRRQAPLKLTFNVALAFAEVATGLAVFHLIAGDAPAVSAQSWIAAYVAVMSSSALSAMAVSLVIFLYEGGLRLADLRSAVGVGLPIACLTTTLGLIATNCLILSTDTAWLLGAAAVICILAYRAYAALADRHLSLERLYRFSQVVGSAPEVEDVIQSVLAQARDLLRAESADLVLLPDPGGLVGRRFTYDGTHLASQEAPEMAPTSWLRQHVVDQGEALLVSRSHRAAEARDYLGGRGIDEALAAPLRGAHGIVGAVVVADRMGSVRSFSLEDIRLLETVANHAAIALENGKLVDRLRHEALHDSLTGLPNRVRLEAVLNEQLVTPSRRLLGRPGPAAHGPRPLQGGQRHPGAPPRRPPPPRGRRPADAHRARRCSGGSPRRRRVRGRPVRHRRSRERRERCALAAPGARGAHDDRARRARDRRQHRGRCVAPGRPRRRRPAQVRRRRDVRRQEQRPRGRVLPGRPRPQRTRPARDGHRAARRAGAGRDQGARPAQGRPGHRTGDGRRAAGPVGPPGPGAHRA